MRSSTIIIILFGLTSCQEDSFQVEPIDNGLNDLVDSRLLSYFNEFEYEAKKRGLAYDLSALEITGEIKNIPETNVAGTCQYGRHLSHVTVDLAYWNSCPIAIQPSKMYCRRRPPSKESLAAPSP